MSNTRFSLFSGHFLCVYIYETSVVNIYLIVLDCVVLLTTMWIDFLYFRVVLNTELSNECK